MPLASFAFLKFYQYFLVLQSTVIFFYPLSFFIFFYLSATTTMMNFTYPFFTLGTTELHPVNTAKQSAAQ